MQVKEIMTINPESIDFNSSITEAAQKMKQFDVGSLPVMKEGKVSGIITDRDIVLRCIAESKDISGCKVGDAMTPQIFYCYKNDDLHNAASMMEEKQIHRLLVLNDDEQPVGFVSLADFACKSKDERLAWEILEKISEPACIKR